MSQNKVAASIVAGMQQLEAGRARLAEVLRQQAQSRPTTEKVAEISVQRDELVSKLASAGLIEPSGSVEIRQSLDNPGGVEFLMRQLVDHHVGSTSSEKQAASPQLGEASSRKTASKPAGRSPSFQSPYHR